MEFLVHQSCQTVLFLYFQLLGIFLISVTLDGLKQCSSLQTLILRYNSVSIIPAAISALPELWKLDLSHNLVSFHAVQKVSIVFIVLWELRKLGSF